jgi:hypothetical protein
VFRGRFVTSEKLKEYREFLAVKSGFSGAGLAFLGLSLGLFAAGESSATSLGLISSAFFFIVAYRLDKLYDNDFEKIEDAIEDADRGENQ